MIAAAPACKATSEPKAVHRDSAAPAVFAAKRVPVDPRSRGSAGVLSDPGQFSVDAFIFLNWPAIVGQRGVINTTVPLGQGSAVWETFKNATEIYLPAGATPCSWTTVCELPTGVTPPTLQQLQQTLGPTDSNWLHFLAQDRMIDGQQVVDANTSVIRYDVRCNQDHFNYVVANASGYPLYTLEGQEQALSDSGFTFNFPSNALEVKAAWRVLNPTDDASRYWTAYGAYYDANQNLVYAKIGLTAFHIISNATPGWIWMTYEQVDNPTATFKYFLGQKGSPVGPNRTVNPAAAGFNAQLATWTQGTKWQFYQIIGWQTTMTDPAGKPVILANSNIETYFPRTSSCMSCHDMANIGPLNNVRLNFWNDRAGNLSGRVGNIDFPAIAKQLDPADTFKQMNYVWSLREAKATQTPAPAQTSKRP